MPIASFDDIVDYVVAYCEQYKATFDGLVAPEPVGQGLPKVPPPPFASHAALECWIVSDGAVLVDQSGEPSHAWWIAGGPALMVDFEPSRRPPEVFSLLERDGLKGKNIGIYRIVGRDIPENVWAGTLPRCCSESVKQTSFGKEIIFRAAETSILELLKRLTFGAFGHILDLKLKSEPDDFWDNVQIQRIGIFPADISSKRFFRLIEISHNRSFGAWDKRGLWLRVRFDCYRDILSETFFARQGGGTLGLGSKNTNIASLLDRTRQFENLIHQLQSALAVRGEENEIVFQQFLEDHPELLDLYGRVIPKPRFSYPAGTSPTGKSYVEPDFVIAYSDGTYRVVEIERPNKRISTSKGQPRSEVTQAVFQLSEFRTFIEDHASDLQSEFPGIRASGCRYTLIIGRKEISSESPFCSFEMLRTHVRSTYRADDVWVFDDLIDRARTALDAFRGLSRFASIDMAN